MPLRMLSQTAGTPTITEATEDLYLLCSSETPTSLPTPRCTPVRELGADKRGILVCEMVAKQDINSADEYDEVGKLA